MKISLEEQLDSIFNIPKDGSNIKEEDDESQETSYAEVINNKDTESFINKAQKIKDVLAKDAPPIDVEYIEKEDSHVVEQRKSAEVEKKKEKKSDETSFEKILTNSVRTDMPISQEVQSVVQEQTAHNKNTDVCEDDTDENEERTSVNSDVIQNKPDAHGWLLLSPSPMFNHFYAQKAFLVQNITKTGEQLQIDKLLEELKISYVNTTVEMSDLHGMYDKLSQIQNYLDRVVQIKILATSQCAASKRGVELLRGVLAKVCYEKPAARQDGVNYDHMRDIELYACQLEGLEQCAKDVYHNLLEAKEILSRKISVAIELFKQQHLTDNLDKSVPAAMKNAVQNLDKSTMRDDLQNRGFDRLDVQEAVKVVTVKEKQPIKKSGETSWFD